MSLLDKVQTKHKKASVANVRSGDTVKVYQNIKEGNKQRVQVFQGLVIRVSNRNSLTYRILVRRITGGIGVEKSFLMHSPSITKVEITKRSKVRRNYLSYMRARTGKAARLTSVGFDEKNQEIKSETAHTQDSENSVKDTDEKQTLEDKETQKTQKEKDESPKIQAETDTKKSEDSKEEPKGEETPKKQAD
jgi:large subunit ribosomal protein L19